MLEALLPAFDRLVLHPLHEPPRAVRRARWPAWSSSWAGRSARRSPTRAAALERARALAGPGGAVVATGSIYLVGDLVRQNGAARASTM